MPRRRSEIAVRVRRRYLEPSPDLDVGRRLTTEGQRMSKILILAAGAAGYIAGARAGRGRYETIASQAQRVWSNPKVRKAADEAKDAAASRAPVIKDKLSDAASGISNKVGSGGGGKHGAT